MKRKDSFLSALLAMLMTRGSSFSILETPQKNSVLDDVKKIALSSMLGTCILFNNNACTSIVPGGEALAAESRVIGEIAGSGIVFKVSIRSLDPCLFFLVAYYVFSYLWGNVKRILLQLSLSMTRKSRE